MILENWGVRPVSPYAPPEAGIVINGQVFGDSKREDGKWVNTSNVVKIDGNKITTQNSIYELGSPHKKYIKYCKKVGCHIPTPEEPIRIIENEDVQ